MYIYYIYTRFEYTNIIGYAPAARLPCLRLYRPTALLACGAVRRSASVTAFHKAVCLSVCPVIRNYIIDNHNYYYFFASRLQGSLGKIALGAGVMTGVRPCLLDLLERCL